jgi:hypothetical protein
LDKHAAVEEEEKEESVTEHTMHRAKKRGEKKSFPDFNKCIFEII